MAAGDYLSVLSHGLVVSDGGAADYPAEGDVREGVTYADGALTGTLELPAESDVRAGVLYGEDGNEFTGTLAVPTAPDPETCPTIALCDQLVAELLAMWSDRGADDGVERAYFKRFGDGRDPVCELTGRQVTVYPTDYENGPASRGEDEYEHRVSVQVLERYTGDAGDPPTAWTDARVNFVHTYIVQGFDYGRGRAAFNLKLWTKTAAVRMYDVGYLTTGGKVFFSQIDLVFGEIRDA